MPRSTTPLPVRCANIKSPRCDIQQCGACGQAEPIHVAVHVTYGLFDTPKDHYGTNLLMLHGIRVVFYSKDVTRGSKLWKISPFDGP